MTSIKSEAAPRQRLDSAQEILRLLQRRWRLILVTTTLVALCVAIDTITSLPIYETSVKLLVTEESAKQLEIRNFYQPIDKEFCHTQAEILKSLPVAERVVRELKMSTRTSPGSLLNRVYRRITSLFGESAPAKGLPEAKRIEAAALGLQYKIKVQLVRNTTILIVSVEDWDPQFVARLANSVAENFLVQTCELRKVRSRQVSEQLIARLQETRDKLTAGEKALRKFEEENQAAHLDIQIKQLVEQRVPALETDLAAVEKDLAEEEARVATSTAQLEKQYKRLLSGQQAGVTSQLKMQLPHKEAELARLLLSYTPNHPEVLKMQLEVEAIKKQLATEQSIQHSGDAQATDRVTENLEVTLNTAEQVVASKISRRKEVLEQLAETRLRLKAHIEKSIEHAILEREVEASQKLYEVLLMRQKEISLNEETTTSAGYVIEKATVPTRPIRPRKTTGILLGLLLGLVASFALIFVLESVDNSIRGRADVAEMFGLHVLGSIPSKATLTATDGPAELISLSRPNSVMAESFRALRLSLRHTPFKMTPFPEGQRVVLITSSQPGEGKTTTSSNLAISVAQGGDRVLLVDCDLRRHRIENLFGLQGKPGLTALGTRDIEELIHPTSERNLFVLPAGDRIADPAGFLDRPAFRDHLARISSGYDWVFLDGPPVNPISDSLSLAPLAGTVVMVVGLGTVTPDEVMLAVDRLRNVQVKVSGIIVNNRDVREEGNRAYGSYYTS